MPLAWPLWFYSLSFYSGRQSCWLHLLPLSERILRNSNLHSPAFVMALDTASRLIGWGRLIRCQAKLFWLYFSPSTAVCVLKRMLCTFMVELCTYSSHRHWVILLLPELCGLSIQGEILPSLFFKMMGYSLRRMWDVGLDYVRCNVRRAYLSIVL